VSLDNFSILTCSDCRFVEHFPWSWSVEVLCSHKPVVVCKLNSKDVPPHTAVGIRILEEVASFDESALKMPV